MNESAEQHAQHRFDPRINVVCFLLTVATVFWVAPNWSNVAPSPDLSTLQRMLSGWTFAVPLLVILLFHEFGHYFAARIHGIPASLPYFIPIPIMVGTFGAVIAVRERVRSRNALLDFGAAGPLAGLAVALPILALGLSMSPVEPLPETGYIQEGQSLLYIGLKYLIVGPIPAGYDVMLHPTAMAGWVGLLLTMLNLIPYGQLDGGHIAYALLGERHTHFGRWLRWGVLALFAVVLAWFVTPVIMGMPGHSLGNAISNSLTWLVWFGLLSLIRRVQGGDAHPPTDDTQLSPVRRWVGWTCAVLFVLLFMPTPLTQA